MDVFELKYLIFKEFIIDYYDLCFSYILKYIV